MTSLIEVCLTGLFEKNAEGMSFLKYFLDGTYSPVQ